MSNQIVDNQNTQRFLEYLAASSNLYGNVKKTVGLQIFLTVLFPIVLSILSIIFPDKIKAWAALYGLVISIFDAVLIDSVQKNWKKEAAKVQECFDCQLYGLDWNEFKVGDKPKPEQIHESAKNFLSKNSDSELKNWYSPFVQELPLSLARIVCQRSNIYWDSKLRRNYSWWLIGFCILIFLAGISISMLMSMNLPDYILVILAPTFPSLLWLIREIKRQFESSATLDRLMKYAEKLWKDILENKLTDEELKVKSRELQDELYSHRYSNQPIFNWIYKIFRSKQEEQMNIGAERLVKELTSITK